MGTIGKKTKTERGFGHVEFNDAYDKACSIQCSSAIGEYEDAMHRPGTSFLWLGIDKVEPLVMARDAKGVGVETSEENGWVPYPVPTQVQLNARMHLNREQVEGLVKRLQGWLKNGTL